MTGRLIPPFLSLALALLVSGTAAGSPSSPAGLALEPLLLCDSLPGGVPFQAVALLSGGDGSLYATDANQCRILRFDSAGRYLSDAGGCGTGPFRLSRPGGLVRRTGFGLFVCDPDHGTIVQFDEALRPLSTFTPRLPDNAPFSPFAAAASREGTLFVCDPVSGRVVAFGRDGTTTPLLPTRAPGAPLSIKPRAVIHAGRIYLYDENSPAIRAFDKFGNPRGAFGLGRRVADFGLAAFGDSLILASDPDQGHIRLYGLDGRDRGLCLPSFDGAPFRTAALAASRDRLFAARADGRAIAAFRIAP